MGMFARVLRFNWTIERKLVASFTAAILVGFLVMIGLQARDQRTSLVDLAVSDLTAKTTQLGNAMRIGFMGHDGSAIETEYKPLSDAPDTGLASLASFQDDGTLILKFENDKPNLKPIDLTGILKDAPDVLAKGTPFVTATATHLVTVVPVMSLRGTKVIGALAIAWSLDAQNAAVSKALRNQTVVALVVMIVLLAILAVLLRRMVVRPIRDITEVMRRLAAGETGIAIPAAARKDEIGAMAASVIIFRDTAEEVARIEAEREEQKRLAEESRRQTLLQLAARLESSVKTVADSVAGAANQVERNARSMADAAQTATGQTSAVAAASEETSVSIQTVAAAAEELTASIGELGRQAAGSASVAEGAVQEAGATSTKVEHLEAAAGRIGEVVKLISDIAAQTNLLALNATIEAARAGDAGKGFAVVASEVKSLAAQTGRATEEITTQVTAIRTATQEVVQAIHGIEATITKISEIAGAMTMSIDQQGQATQEIARNVQQAATGAGEVSENIIGVTRIANETGRNASSILGAAGDLVRQSDLLTQSLNEFLAAARAS